MGRRARQRLIRHLLLLSGSSFGVWGVFTAMTADDPRFKLSMATAYVALALLCLTLTLGPRNVLTGRPNPVSTHLRRDVGIWAGIVSLVHVVAGLQVHMRGNMIQYFTFPPEWDRAIPIRYDPFGLANWMGLVSALVLVLLLALSNDLSLRELGATRWKSLQRWSYAAFALMALHGALYQWILESRSWPWIVLFVGLVLFVTAVQVAGFRSIRSGGGKPRR